MMTPLSTMTPPMDPATSMAPGSTSQQNPPSAVGQPSAMTPLTSMTPGLASQERENVNCDHIPYKHVQQSASQFCPSFQECKPHWTAHCCGLARKNDPATDGTPGDGILMVQMMIFTVLVKIMSNSSHVLSSTVFESKLAGPKTRNRLKDLLLPWCGG